MEQVNDELIYGDWAALRSNPNIIIRVELINPNGIVDFRSQRNSASQHAHISELIKITNPKLIADLERNYHQFE